MKDWLDDLRLAVGMLTRIPVPHPDGASPPYLARAHRVFPLVGAAIGATIGIVYAAFVTVGAPTAAAAALALGVGMLLTGGFHEDGLADLADGFGGGSGKTAKLEIMRDSRLGTYGALALLVTFAVKVTAVAALPAASAVAALAAAHALSRAPLPTMTIVMPYGRADGLAAAAGKSERSIAAIAATLAFVIALLCCSPVDAILAAIVAAAAAAGIGMLAWRQVGGYTGDVLGAAQQIAETATLLLLAIRHG